ncbi:MAG: endo alpha-1,4 polygalactosaminidase [Thermoplasmata archaeon]|nr:MAG: endo alpha-1,4 polygalactosaminidase [Thermoplasmata archaeon]
MKHNNLKIMMVYLLAITFVINSGCISEEGNNDEGNVPDQSEDALFPDVVSATAGPLALNEIDYWAYVIQDVEENEDLLERSRYEMLVIEPTRTDFSEEYSRSYKTKELVTKLKASAGNNEFNRKLVIAYIDIGQAEDWRWYWKWSVDSDWDPLETSKPSDWPSWIITHDPEWVGCFPVAYWHEDWRNIVIDGGFTWDGNDVEVPSGNEYGGEGYNSILDEVINDGFDGIYLDWVEAFSDESVIEAAETAAIDPVEAMFDFIEEMREYGRTRFQEMGRDPDEWIIIQQNAPDLADSSDPRKFTVIDGIAEEGVWWEGTGDSGWDDPNGYDVSAKEELGADWYNDVLNNWLPAYRDAGIPVFACEYALENAEDVYEDLAPDAGFVPYCTRRSLSKLTTTPPSFE